MDAEQYVDRLVEAERDGMIERAKWISDYRPQFSAGMAISGGEESTILYDDAQLCYIYGLFSGTIVLGQSFIERSVCGVAYSAGEFTEDERPGYHDAVDFLEENNILTPDEVEGIALDELHKLRNPLVHFRKPTDESTLLGRKMESVRERPETKAPTTYEMLKEDAEKVLRTCFSVSRIFGV
ncbi:hypothetical protein ACFOZ7_22305 [Natribaculum luteum]|uniref:HEPN domain-containing protein n=1 Tax=Natribaculum luteum TaxID=1586232 RepID=A0ABD5P653_9EURY|nr:hypothetical protein [Natribaculum luteum]